MPYQPGAVVHGVTHVGDVYKSNNVYANNVPVALWLTPGTSEAFAFASIASPVDITPEASTAISAQTALYLDNPSAFYSPQAQEIGVKPNITSVPVAVSTGTVAPVPPATSVIPFTSDIVTFLTKILAEADRGMWDETGMKKLPPNGVLSPGFYQPPDPSNPNILNIWKELGLTGSYWLTDQTPWCMGFVNWVLKKTGHRWAKEAQVFNLPANPSRWNATSVPPTDAQPGDMAVWRYVDARGRIGGHISFVYQIQNGRYNFVGGNQEPKKSTDTANTQTSNNNPSKGTVNISFGDPKRNFAPVYNHATASNKIASLWRPSKA